MSSHIYADERAREMEFAAGSERQMGCSPLGRMISRVIKKCNGKLLYSHRNQVLSWCASQFCCTVSQGADDG
jgi:hypothetical protein